DLGYDEFFEAGRQKMGLGGFEVARVIAEYKELYRVRNAEGEYLAKITGKQIFNAVSREDFPAVGDWVAISKINEEQAIIEGILPRRSMIKRKAAGKNEIQIIAANIDVALVTQAVDGDYSLNRFERYFAISRDGGVLPAVVLNKIDLISKEDLDFRIGQIKSRFGDIDIIAASTITEAGLDELRNYIAAGKTYCFLGSSGVGKSTLINKLIGKEAIKTGAVSADTDRGRHTTTGREMYFLGSNSSAPLTMNGIVIDNPGMREVGMADAGAGVENVLAKSPHWPRNANIPTARTPASRGARCWRRLSRASWRLKFTIIMPA
ncbi:MAG TPA: GTPase RsgA, partial [Candidatus Pacearchaeota archaeon]|nr:GTPase RsgA [Candidatus Pacearchaeota archaeon]